MSEAGYEQKYIHETFDTKRVVLLEPNVNGFEKNFEDFVNGMVETQCVASLQQSPLDKKVVALSAGMASVHLALLV